MLNKLLRFIREYDMLSAGDSVACAVSGGADSMALLWGLYLLREKLDVRLSAAHFNHCLRGAESDRDEAFVRSFCERFEIPLSVGSAKVRPGPKGLEAAAREARYAFFATLPGKTATAHTADDNAETVLMHLVRGTGLKGLGGIAPVNGSLIRPMLGVQRREVLAFLNEYHISYVEDSSNGGDAFLRNRLRHYVMPLLAAENPRLPENVSRMALRLREDEAALDAASQYGTLPPVEELKALPAALRSRMLERFLKESGVKEPEAEHIALAEGLLFSDKPSASGSFPGGVTLRRKYGRLEAVSVCEPLEEIRLPLEGTVELPELEMRVVCVPAAGIRNSEHEFTVRPQGPLVLRCRQSGDEMRLPGGTRSLKKLFIDRRIPAGDRGRVPVIADDLGVIGVYGIGMNRDRIPESLPAVQLRFESIHSSEML